jgi:cytoplasmic tRNA 2-thiolation protein 2
MRPPPQAGDALIALSGGAGSTALLDVLAERKYLGVEGAEYDITRGKTPPIWGRAYAVHVVFPDSWEGRAGVGPRLRAMAEERGVQYLEVRAEDVFDASLGERVRAMVDGSGGEGELLENRAELTPGPDNSARLAALLASLPLSSRPTLLGHILDALLSTVAASLPNISHLILGETATREAQRVIAGTAQGRGWSLPLDLATLGSIPLLTEEPRDVMRLRGVREVSVKEAALYCHARGLETFNFRLWGRGRKEGSIEGLTERESATGAVSS